MMIDLLDDLLLQLANEERTEAEEITNIGLLIILDMTGTYLLLPVLSWLRNATVIVISNVSLSSSSFFGLLIILSLEALQRPLELC